VAKRFDPRVKFSIDWPLEGWIPCKVNNRQAATKYCLALVSTVGNVVLEKVCKAFGGLD